MLMAHPAVLARLVEEYEALHVLDGESCDDPEVRRLEDVAYMLCVSTGTSDVDAALVAARYDLPGARTADDSQVSSDGAPAAS
jgi:hypothetical protein